MFDHHEGFHMRYSRRLLLILSALFAAVTFLLMMTANAAQTTVSTPGNNDIDLTPSEFDVLLTRLAQTRSALAPTRTAIAITRDPSLLTPLTANSIERTATTLWTTVTADAQIAATQRSEGTLD